MNKQYPQILNDIFGRHPDMMPISIPEGTSALVVMYKGQAYRVGINEINLLEP